MRFDTSIAASCRRAGYHLRAGGGFAVGPKWSAAQLASPTRERGGKTDRLAQRRPDVGRGVAAFDPELRPRHRARAIRACANEIDVLSLSFYRYYPTIHTGNMITAAQLRAARALLGMDQRALAVASGLSLPTIQRMEASEDVIRGQVESLMKLIAAIEAAGVEFINQGAISESGGRGVRLKPH